MGCCRRCGILFLHSDEDHSINLVKTHTMTILAVRANSQQGGQLFVGLRSEDIALNLAFNSESRSNQAKCQRFLDVPAPHLSKELPHIPRESMSDLRVSFLEQRSSRAKVCWYWEPVFCKGNRIPRSQVALSGSTEWQVSQCSSFRSWCKICPIVCYPQL